MIGEGELLGESGGWKVVGHWRRVCAVGEKAISSSLFLVHKTEVQSFIFILYNTYGCICIIMSCSQSIPKQMNK